MSARPAERLPIAGHLIPADQLLLRAAAFAAKARRRRSIRAFARTKVSKQVIAECLAAACSAPSGANRQPWHFVAISDQQVKDRIREAAETVEREFYNGKAPQAWLDALAPIGTDWQKPFLSEAPWLIAIFAEHHGVGDDGEKQKHYYVHESVGIATGILIAALNDVGLATLTHTPAPMTFLSHLLERPAHEKPFLLLVVGHPAPDATVPDLERKPQEAMVTWLRDPADITPPRATSVDDLPPT